MKFYIVQQSYIGLLYEDGSFKKQLKPGKHKIKNHIFDTKVRGVVLMDMRERSITIKGQEILTNDKVAIRVSLLVYYQVVEPEAAAHNVASYEERIYEDVQLAARRFLASRDLNAILSDRNEISTAVREEVSSAAASYGVEIIRADVKDLVFPGNLREIMNRVLETERRAEAELIEARKEAEVMSIRSTAEADAELRMVQTEKEQVKAMAEVEMLKFENRLKTDIKEAKALEENPELIKLKQLHTLAEMSKLGANFSIGLDKLGLDKVLKE